MSLWRTIPLSLVHTFLLLLLNQCPWLLKDQEYKAALETCFHMYKFYGPHSLPSTCSDGGWYEVQKQMVLVCWVKNTTIFKVIEEMIIDIQDTVKYIPPQTFNSLIMNTAPSNHSSSSWLPIWMLQHEHRHSNIFTPLIWPDSWGKSILLYCL